MINQGNSTIFAPFYSIFSRKKVVFKSTRVTCVCQVECQQVDLRRPRIVLASSRVTFLYAVTSRSSRCKWSNHRPSINCGLHREEQVYQMKLIRPARWSQYLTSIRSSGSTRNWAPNVISSWRSSPWPPGATNNRPRLVIGLVGSRLAVVKFSKSRVWNNVPGGSNLIFGDPLIFLKHNVKETCKQKSQLDLCSYFDMHTPTDTQRHLIPAPA